MCRFLTPDTFDSTTRGLPGPEGRTPPYPRWMATIPDPVGDFLATGPLAHVVTLDPDGTPYVTLAWAGFDGDELVFATFFGTDQRKLRNLRRDPHVSLSFEATEHDGEGLHPYMVIRGRAQITEGGALEVMDKLAEHYIGQGATYALRDVPAGVVTHVTVEEVYGQRPLARVRPQGVVRGPGARMCEPPSAP
jgi:PPOX class probable F420-dependent enzyme